MATITPSQKSVKFSQWYEDCEKAIELANENNINVIEYTPISTGSCDDRKIFCILFSNGYSLISYHPDQYGHIYEMIFAR